MTTPALSKPLTHVSPLVYQCEWGRAEVEGLGWVKDCILYPGGGEHWVWEDGEDHGSALSLDLLTRLAGKADLLVLSLGVESRLTPSSEGLQMVAAWGGRVVLAPTPAAVSAYNGFVQEGKRVALALHTTC